jgi:hypothetical protein
LERGSKEAAFSRSTSPPRFAALSDYREGESNSVLEGESIRIQKVSSFELRVQRGGVKTASDGLWIGSKSSSVKEARIILLLIILAVGIYFLPWVIIRNTASLSMGAYDLAEWASLHPAVRHMAFVPGATLLLRVPLACLTVMATILIARLTKQTIIRGLFIVTSALALLPPLEFLTSARGDTNYTQQFMIAISTVVIGALCTQKPLFTRAELLISFLAVIAVITGLVGLKMAYDLIRDFNLPSQVGSGAILLPTMLLTITFIEIREIKNKTG